MIRFAQWCAALVAVVMPNIAQACAVCFGGEYDNRQQFIDTTAILTFAPLILIGLFIWLMVRRIRRVESQRQADLAKDREAPLAEVALPPSGP